MRISVAALFMLDEHVLLAQRTNEGSMALRWELPGGKLEQGESAIDALRRELLEELNITIKTYQLCTEGSFENKGIQHQLLVYRCTSPAITVKTDITSLVRREHLQFAWIAIQDLSMMSKEIVDSDRAVLAKLFSLP